MKRLLALAVLLTLSLPVNAEDDLLVSFNNGSELLSICEQDYKAHCFGYIEGIYDGHAILDGWGDLKGKIFCSPKTGITISQLRLIVVKYLNEHLELLHQTASSSVLNALAGAFPCTE